MRHVTYALISTIYLSLFLLLMPVQFAPLAFAQPSTETLQDSPSTRDTFAQITARPNPVEARQGTGTTKVSWHTGDNTVGQVYVSENGGPEKLFASAPDGSSEVSWISKDSTYVFRLYSTGDSKRLLAAVEVKGIGEVTGKSNLTRLASKAISTRILIPLVLPALLLVGAWYAFRQGKRQLSKNLLTTTAVLATTLTLLSVITVEPRPLQDQPFPDAHENADAARQLASGKGFVTFIYDNQPRPPRYPPGFAVALVPFAAFSNNYPSNLQTGVKIFAALYVLVAVIAAWSVGGPLAATLTAVLIGVSPFARVAASLLMSDALGAAGTALFILLLHRFSALRISVAGALAGALVAVRLPLVINLVALVIVLPMRWRARALLCASPPLAALGLFNWITFGSPLNTGYGYWLPGLKSFAWSYAFASPPRGDGPWIVADALNGLLMQWICPCPLGGSQAALPNIFFYPAVLLGLFWTFVPPLTLCGFFYIWKHRRETVAHFTLWVTALNLLLFTFYFYQGTRFMAGPATLLIIFTSVNAAQWAERRIKLGRKNQSGKSELSGLANP